MLVWTADYPSARQNKKLPVLDVCMWTEGVVGGTVLKHKFYSESVANPVTIHPSSALPSSMNISTYRQEADFVLNSDAEWRSDRAPRAFFQTTRAPRQQQH